MPVFFFSLSQVTAINYPKALLVFFIIHFLMYPASNGYNSYMDQDEESIGMLERPPKPTRQLFYLTGVLDIMALGLSLFVNILFAVCILANVLASRAYSYRGIRLKKYPVAGFLTVIIFQGAITFLMVYIGALRSLSPLSIPWQGMIISSLLFGGFYPLTQVYQHEQDLKDGVKTISYKLGIKGTFVFSGIMYALAELALFIYFQQKHQLTQFAILQLFFIPVLVYFIYWWKLAVKNVSNANFRYSFRMNMVAAVSTNAAFILLYFLNHPSA
ncbi:MAG: UbiA prenyltransferase family protein [Chitinophagaceae bacterium]|nr:UbiA prenyltransferase family protein [Chitinophagaceae bacterium]